MGSLSNLYISQSYQSLIHLGSDTSATTTPTQLQDGIGTNIGIYVNTNGEVSASSFSGSIAGIGNVSAFSSSVNSRILAITASGGIPTGTVSSSAQITAFGFATTASLNSYTQSTNTFTASISTSVGLLQTFSGSQYKTDSSSFNSRINTINTSFNSYTQSTNTFTASISTSVGLLETFSASSDSRYVRNSQTSSMAVSSSTYAVTASYALNAQTASEARNLVIIARNGNQSTLAAGTVVHITGASGDNPIFNTASFDTEALSANTLGIIRTAVNSGSDCEVVVNGIVTGVNTDPTLGYVAGDVVYLGANGTFTRTQPQAPNQIVVLGQVLRAQQNNGSLYVSINNGWELNELHNVQINTPLTNQFLVYESASYGLWKNKSAATLGLATTGSNSFTGSQIVTGSLTILGNLTAYTASFVTVTSSVVVGGNTILLNTFTPSVRYGGIEVIDSGSSGLTGSMLWDSQNDVWVYVNPSGSSYVSARLISGPKSLTLGSEPTLTQNRVPKADDGDHLVDSQIIDNGTNVIISLPLSASGGIVGDTYISNGVLQVSTFPNVSKQWFTPTTIEAIGTASVAYEQFVNDGGYDAFNVITTLNSGSEFRDLPSDTFVLNTWLQIPQNTGTNPAPQFKRGLGITGSLNITGSSRFAGNQSITGSLILSSSAATELQVIGGVEITGSVAGNITALSVTSNTASIDFSRGTFFTLTIPSSAVTYITGSNLKPGMTANIVLTQQATTGSVRWESSLFKFPSGSINTGSATGSAVDLVSVMSVNSTTLLSVGANRLI